MGLAGQSEPCPSLIRTNTNLLGIFCHLLWGAEEQHTGGLSKLNLLVGLLYTPSYLIPARKERGVSIVRLQRLGM